MRKTIHGLLIIAVVLFSVTAVSAMQVPPGRWWHMPQVVRQLDLTPNEKSQLDRLFRDNRHKLIDLKARIEKERFDLMEMLESPKLDEQRALEQFRKLENARRALAEERFRFLLEVRKILGAERFHSLRSIYKGFRQNPKGSGRRRMPPVPR